MHIEGGKKQETIAAYRRISPNSKLYLKANIAIFRTLIDSKAVQPEIDDLKQADSALATIKTLSPDGLEHHHLSTLLMQKAVELIATKTIKESATTNLLGRKLYLVEMQRGAEFELRSCARFAENAAQRIEFIDKANAIRPISFV